MIGEREDETFGETLDFATENLAHEILLSMMRSGMWKEMPAQEIVDKAFGIAVSVQKKLEAKSE